MQSTADLAPTDRKVAGAMSAGHNELLLLARRRRRGRGAGNRSDRAYLYLAPAPTEDVTGLCISELPQYQTRGGCFQSRALFNGSSPK